MKINNEVKLDFDDVLLVPQRTKTASRQNIELIRNFSFYNSSSNWHGVPIFAANMDTTGTFSMSNVLVDFEMPTCLHKHYKLNALVSDLMDMDYQWFSLGIKDRDLIKLKKFVDYSGVIPNICIDVANGYTDDFVEFCAKIRSTFGKSPIIMAGNVCTPEMVQEIILHGGVDIVKIGIGPGSACTTRLKTGCFIKGTKVNTSSGYKEIENIGLGEFVLTHDGSYQKVLQKHDNGIRDDLLSINGIVCTKDHKFYVVEKKDSDKINEENIHDFAYWLEASQISEDNHYIIEILE